MDNLNIATREKMAGPTNVDISNDYVGVDRGMFSVVTGPSIRYGRITSANFKTYGPTLAPGYLSFKIETFDEFPLTESDYANADKSEFVYDTHTIGSKSVPILMEYWGKTSYINLFANKTDVSPLDEIIMAGIQEIGNSYTGVILGSDDPRTISVEINYESSSTAPLEMIDYTITVHVPDQDDVTHVVPLTEVTPLFDPVLYIRNL